MRFIGLTLLGLLVSSPLAAQPSAKSGHEKKNGPDSSIAVSVEGLGCAAAGPGGFAARSWSLGATNSGATGSGGGAGTGKASLGPLVIEKATDGCSPALFGGVVTGSHFRKLTLTQSDDRGVALMTLALEDVLISSWKTAGNIEDPLPTEEVQFTYDKVCLTDVGTGARFCYDAKQGKTF
jgi:type VI protein secretion system component Hcp